MKQNDLLIMNQFYMRMSAYINSFKWANRTTKELNGEKGFIKFIALVGGFLWWISYIVASFLFTYTVLGWSFLNFKLDSALRIASIVSIVVFLILAIGMIMHTRLRYKAQRTGPLWGTMIFDFTFGTLVTVMFTLIMSYVVSLSSSLTIIAVMLGLQIPFFINMVLDLFLLGWLKYRYAGKMTHEDYHNKDRQCQRIKIPFVIIVEILMLGFIIYFGAIPYFQSGGLEAIKDKALSVFQGKDTITLLVGSKGIVVAGATLLSIIISTIVRIKYSKIKTNKK